MELKQISLFEAQINNMPANLPEEGKNVFWYGLSDEGQYKGFMEITESDGISEISFFMIPSLYQGHRYGDIMLELYLDQYIPKSEASSMLTAVFEYNGDHGLELNRLFSDHGFDISLRHFRECRLPFDTVHKKLASKKTGSYSGRMVNLASGISAVLDNIRQIKDIDITARDVSEASVELSVAALNEEGKLEALLLADRDQSQNEVQVTHLFTDTDDPTILRRFLSFAVENARQSMDPPKYITFVAANEKLEKVMDSFFDEPETAKLIMADAEFNLCKYLEQLKVKEIIKEVRV